MESRTRLFGAAALTLFALPSTMPAPRGDCGAELEIDDASLIFEVNETDGDAEVVLRLKAPEGFRRLELEDPNGKRVFVLKAKGNVKQAVGLQQFVIESGEPNVVDVLATFPEGTYEVEGETVSGQEAEGELVLSHDLAPAPAYCPADGALVPPNGVVVQWIPVGGAASYVVEIEQDDLGYNLTATVPAGVTSLQVPDGFLLANTEYELAVATVSLNGNTAVAESSFTTAP